MAQPTIATYRDIIEDGGPISFNVTLPTSTAAGDLLLAIIAKDDDPLMYSSHGMVDALAGGGVGGDYGVYAWWKIAVAADITRGYMTFTGDSEDYVGRMYRITGFNSSNPIFTVGAPSIATTATPTAPSINTIVDTLVFAFAGMDDNDIPYSVTTAGWTQNFNNSCVDSGCIIATRNANTAGATGACAFATAASDGAASAQIAINGNVPPTVALGAPADGASVSDTTPDLTFTGTDGNDEALEYEVQIDNVSTFDSQPISTITTDDTFYGTVYYLGPNQNLTTLYFGGWGDAYYDYFKFDISSMPASADVGTVLLYIYIFTPSTNDPVAHVRRVTSAWDGSTLTSTNLPTENTTNRGSLPALNGGSSRWVSVDITQLYKDWKNGVSTNYGLKIHSTITSNNNNGSFASKETTGYEPYLFFGGSPLIKALSTDETGFSAGASHPTASGAEQTYTVQTPLDADTYYWRVRAIDPAGNNQWGAWSPGDSTLGYDHFDLEAGTSVNVAPSPESAAFATLTPTISTTRSVNISASLPTFASDILSPVVVAVRSVAVTATLLTATLAGLAPTITAEISVNADVSPAIESAAFATLTPTISISDNESVAVAPESATFELLAPTITTTRSVAVSPAIESATFAIIAPSLTLGDNEEIAVAPLSATLAVLAPTITTNIAVAVAPSPESATFATLTPTISTTGGEYDGVWKYWHTDGWYHKPLKFYVDASFQSLPLKIYHDGVWLSIDIT